MTDELRVASWDDFIGQTELKKRLDVHIRAAMRARRTMEHVLLVGPPGFGKTSLASIIASRLDRPLTEVSMPMDERPFIRMLRWTTGVVFLDEIHRASKSQQESLLPLLEFGYFPDKRGRRHVADDLTFVGATTEGDRIIEPLWERFSIQPDFDAYTDTEMGKIVASMARRAGVKIAPKEAVLLGRAAGGIPRNARSYVLAARDLAEIGRRPTAANVFDLCKVTHDGLTQTHRNYLAALEKVGGTAGLAVLQNLLRLNESMVRELERLLIKLDYIDLTNAGRELTQAGVTRIRELGLKV